MINISGEDLVRLAKQLYRASFETDQIVPKEERPHWLKLARAAASFFRSTILEPGMKSRLAPSKDIPATPVEVVAVRFPTLVSFRLPDGSLLEAEHDTLNDWSIDFGWEKTDRTQEIVQNYHGFKQLPDLKLYQSLPRKGQALVVSLRPYGNGAYLLKKSCGQS